MASLTKLLLELQAVNDKINELYWTFTRCARGKPPACTSEGRVLYRRRSELELLIRERRHRGAR